MKDERTAYLSPKLVIETRSASQGPGAFALDRIETGELLVVWSGHIVDGEQLWALSSDQRRHSIQVEENLYLVSTRPDETADYINHSCNPNAGLSGQIALVAMQPIRAGEEICFDYAMSDGSPYDEFECSCGSANCRGQVTGDDWRRPELWQRYAGYFSPYLQRRIHALQAQMVVTDGAYFINGNRRRLPLLQAALWQGPAQTDMVIETSQPNI